jgi:alpha-galactosidase
VTLDEDLEVWAKPLEDGAQAVGLFNRGEMDAPVAVKWADLGLAGARVVRDLWRQRDLGSFADRFEAKVPRHGVVMIRVEPAAR